MTSRCFHGLAAVLLAACSIDCAAPLPPRRAYFPFVNLHGQIFSPSQVKADARREALGEAVNAVVLAIDERSSFRAVSDAVLRLRERGLAVGYWIELRSASGSDARLAQARVALEQRPPADAIFVAGIEGDRLTCGCRQAICGAVEPGEVRDPRDGARLVAGLRGIAGSAIVVPVWSCEDGPDSLTCSKPECLHARCSERTELAWSYLRAESGRIALQFKAAAAAGQGETGFEVARHVAERLAHWSRIREAAGLAVPFGALTLIAVLPGLEWRGSDLAQALAGVQRANCGGFLVRYAPGTSD